MLRAGKVSPLVVLGVAGVLGLAGMLFFLQGRETPGVRVQKFLTGLAKGNVDEVMAVSKFGDQPDETVRKKWEVCLHRSEYFRFYWKILETFNPSPDEAIVAINIYTGAAANEATEKRYQIPMIKDNGEWFVDAQSLNRDIFPALPR